MVVSDSAVPASVYAADTCSAIAGSSDPMSQQLVYSNSALKLPAPIAACPQRTAHPLAATVARVGLYRKRLLTRQARKCLALELQPDWNSRAGFYDSFRVPLGFPGRLVRQLCCAALATHSEFPACRYRRPE